MKFSEYITQVRADNGLTQAELVDILYIENIKFFDTLTINMLSRWERGVSVPSLEKNITIQRV